MNECRQGYLPGIGETCARGSLSPDGGIVIRINLRWNLRLRIEGVFCVERWATSFDKLGDISI